MASSVATQLERQFSTISGLSVISSTSTLGNTSITLEFDQDRDIDAASIDVQAALLRAERSLPVEMTAPPSYRKINPADSPILFLCADFTFDVVIGSEQLCRGSDCPDTVNAYRRGAGTDQRAEKICGARTREYRKRSRFAI